MNFLQRIRPLFQRPPAPVNVAANLPARPTFPANVRTVTINRIEPSEKKRSNGFFRKGMGIASTTTTKFVFDQKTTTPTPSCQPVGRHTGERRELYKLAPVPTIGNEPIQAPIISVPSGSILSNMQKVSRPFYRLLDDEAYFRKEKRATGDRVGLCAVLCEIEQCLDVTKAKTTEEMGGAEMVVLTGAVAKATANNGRGMGDAARALVFLKNVDLIESIFHPDGTVAPGSAPCPDLLGSRRAGKPIQFDRKDQTLAWAIAHELSTTSVGFEALKKICRRDPPPHPAENLLNANATDAEKAVLAELKKKYDAVTATLDAHNDVMLRLYLKGAREKVEETSSEQADDRRCASDPTYLSNNRESRLPEWTLLDKGLSAIQAHLKEADIYRYSLAEEFFPRDGRLDAALVQRPSSTYSDGANQKKWPPKDQHEWAIAAIRNGVYTDADKDRDGNPTLFFRMQHRLDKNEKWVERAIKQPPARNIKERLSRFKAKAELVCMPSHQKNPYGALNIVKPIDKDAEPGMPPEGVTDGFGNAVQGTIRDSRHHRIVIEILSAAMRKAEPGNGHAAIGPAPIDVSELPADPKRRRALLQKMARIAMLDYAAQKPGYLWHIPHADTLDSENERNHIKKRLSSFVTGISDLDRNQNSHPDRTFFEDCIDDAQGATTDILHSWAATVGGPKNGDEVPEEIDGVENPWFAWGQSLNRIFGNKPYTDTSDAFDSKTKLADAFASGISEGELGSRKTLMNGSKMGVGTKGFSGFLSRVVLTIIGGVRVDARVEKNIQAVVEFGTGAQGSELFFGRNEGWRIQGGGGAQAGLPIDASPVSASATVDAYGAHEGVNQTGIIVRLPRTETGMPGDQANNEKLAKIMKRIIDPPAILDANDPAYCQKFAAGDDARSSLKNMWQEWPEVSTSWVESNETIETAGVSGRVGLGAGVGKARIGLLAVGAGGDTKKTAVKHVESDNAALGVVKYGRGSTSSANIAAGVGSIGAAIAVTDSVGAAVSILGKPLSVGLPSLDAATVQVSVARSGSSLKDTIIMRDGVVHGTSYRLITYQTFDDFEKATAPKLDVYAAVKWKKHGRLTGVPFLIDGNVFVHEANDRDEGLATQHRKGEEFLQKASATAAPSQVFQEYLELRPEAVETANAILSLRATYAHIGDTEKVEGCDKHLDALYENNNSWEETFLIQVEQQTTQSSTQVNAGIRHGRVYTNSSTNLMDGH